MAWQFTPYSAPLVGAGLGIAGLAFLTYRNRHTRGGLPLLGILVAASVWCLAHAVALSSTVRSVKLLAMKVSFLGPFVATTSVFLFAAAYTGRDRWLSRKPVAALFGFHGVSFLLLWIDPGHGLMLAEVDLVQRADLVFLQVVWGPWDAVHTAYSYALMVGAAAMLLDALRRSGDVRTYRGQTLAILVAMVVPWGLSVAYITGFTAVDLTALGFTVTGAMIALAVYRYQILEVVPIGRSTAIANIDQAYVVLDADNRVVDVNERTTSLLDADKSALIGHTVEEILADQSVEVDRLEEATNTRTRLPIRIDGRERYFDVDISPIEGRRDSVQGRVVLFRDVTEEVTRKQRLERQKAQLESQNERLEEFASIVAHDLRNPLNVVQGHLELARSEGDPVHFETIESNVERMEAMIDDVLEIARQGQTVEATAPIDLETICRTAWEHVETGGATLEVRTDRTVAADRDRLRHVFENLFRNAVEHAGEDVTVTVGDLPDGFYVEDDGPGIPADEREAVFDKGYSTAAGGTGFGLAIVRTAVEAHGWEIEITEAGGDPASTDDSAPETDERATSSGARFGIRGLQRSVHAAELS